MRYRAMLLVATIVATLGSSVGLANVSAETFQLELKRMEPAGNTQAPHPFIYRGGVRPQHFFMQIGEQVASTARPTGYSTAVRKEPAKLNAKQPLRGVAKLGSGQYGFLLDTKDSDSDSYSRLHFDLNHNGDLSDDAVIEGKPAGNESTGGYWWCRFPRVDLKVETDGQEYDYAFFFASNRADRSYGLFGGSRNVKYVSATLQAAGHREAQIKLAGKTHRVVLLDYNSNGRFDETIAMRTNNASPVYGGYADILLVDPVDASYLDYYTIMGSQIGNLAQIGGALYDVKVTAGGDKLTLTPSTAPVGHVTSPTDGFSALVYNQQGMLKVGGDKSQAVPLPAGEWNLMYYTIERTGKKKPEEQAQRKSALRALTTAFIKTETQTGPTRLMARPAADSRIIKVREGQTMALPFGEPFKTVVKASASTKDGKKVIRLGLSLVGAGGEVCSSLSVDGKRPAKPQFTISTPDGKEVQTGWFEYG